MEIAIGRINNVMTTRSLQPTPTVCVVDDDVSVRESLETLVLSMGLRAECFASAGEYLDRAGISGPACLILDVYLPDLNGLDLQARMAAEGGRLPIIFITGYGDVPLSVQAMKAGAFDFLTKPLRDDSLVAAIRSAIDLSRCALDRAAERRALQACFESLTRREREVMAFVVAGRLNKQIGADLGISEITVKAHRGQVMRKMHVRTLADLVRAAAKLNGDADY
jgi:FixJ family two-component response regulator